ncbi:MAG: NAD(P)/FAD-dependent oxidoreductase [Roseburia sp.]|nr:NAD(P)/FAD-dependent oxidoreductase [Roseburia sp.]
MFSFGVLKLTMVFKENRRLNQKKQKDYDVLIIGGGASGLVAAISAARCGAKTVILEHMDRVGKKILATGNGKCNYTNSKQGITKYRGDDPAFVLPVFEQFGFEETVTFFENLGISPKIKNGYYYPASEQAASVLDVLRMELSYQKVAIETDCTITSISKKKDGFEVSTNLGCFCAKKILFSTGLKASPKSGSDGSAIPYIEKLGHHFADIVPALVQLQGKQPFFKALAGIRAEIQANLYINGAFSTSESGELQLTDFGVSGIPIFQLSRFASKALKQKKEVYILLDFQPSLGKKALKQLLSERMHLFGKNKTAEESLIGLFHKKLIPVLLKESQIALHVPAKDVTESQLDVLSNTIKKLRVDVIGTKSFEQAQVCAGGVKTAEIDAKTLESKVVPGVYFAGEVIDIDGTCGGYNLQWAWSSGYVAGKHMAEAVSANEKAGLGKA